MPGQRDVPGQAGDSEQGQSKRVEQLHQAAPAPPGDEGDNRRQRQQAGRTLGQEGQAEPDPHQAHAPAPRRRVRIEHAGGDKAEDGQRLEQGEQRVRRHGVGADHRAPHRHPDARGQDRRLEPQPPGEPEDQQPREREGQRVRQSRGPFVVAEDAEAGADRPVGHRRLGEVRPIRIETGDEPVAELDHLMRHVGVATLVRVPQVPRALEHQAHKQAQHQHEPGAASRREVAVDCCHWPTRGASWAGPDRAQAAACLTTRAGDAGGRSC